MFRKILIANRGEIAMRIIKTNKKLGIKSICIYSEADKNAKYLKEADKSICIGDSYIKESYLNQDKILNIAEMYNCEAIHPGYGFFSENYEFSMQCKQNKIIFIGPDPKFIKIMGNKLYARNIMNNFKIPVIPGSYKSIDSIEEALEIANKIKYPILLKASAGGGGKGIRLANNDIELKENYIIAKIEANKIFSDDSIYIEKFMSHSRHIEFQIAGDNYGNIIYLNERECSIQRNNQKLLEESPACNLNEKKKQELKDIIINTMEKLSYTNLGTLEFLLDKYQNYYFIEMNTRIQVEHPVTEMVLGYDLIEMQIRLALGEKMYISQKDVISKGHAIECRINAENPIENFKPHIGLIENLKIPIESNNIRIDTYIDEKTIITPYYDSMIMKIIVHEKDRKSAINSMKKCLNTILIEGISTTLDLHKIILNDEIFINGNYTCHFLPERLENFIEIIKKNN